MNASGCGHEQMVEMLLKRGASVNLQDGKGYTALTAAAFRNHSSIVRRLLQAGAQSDLRTVYGHTALFMAT